MTVAQLLPLAAGRWTVDKAHSTVRFSVRHMGISNVRGGFGRFDATLVVGDSLEASRLHAWVDMSSIDTGNSMRDGHLQTTDFFDVAVHPTMEFSSASITTADGSMFTMDGILTINGVSQPQRLEVEFLGLEQFPMDGSTHAGFAARGRLSRKAFGIDFNVPLAAGGVVVGDRIELELDTQLLPEAEATAYHDAFVPQP